MYEFFSALPTAPEAATNSRALPQHVVSAPWARIYMACGAAASARRHDRASDKLSRLTNSIC